MADQKQIDLALPVRVVLTDTTGVPSSNTAITIADNGDAAEGATTDTAWVSGAGTVIGLLKTIGSRYISEMAYDGANNLIYFGQADPGTATSAAAWQVRSFTYVGANLTAVLYSNGSRAFNAIWDNRASLSYS